jgi:hypothetical protein
VVVAFITKFWLTLGVGGRNYTACVFQNSSDSFAAYQTVRSCSQAVNVQVMEIMDMSIDVDF